MICGGNTPQELLHNWKRVLQALHKCKLHLSARKTIISPKTTTILGWIWNAGSLSASPHRLNTLATYHELNTVACLRSLIGAYNVLSCVIPRCSSYLAPLNAVTASRPSQESINWTDDLKAVYRSAQSALSSALTIPLPRPEDQLWIVTDRAVWGPGIGATLYVTRGDKLHVSDFFSTKCRAPKQRGFHVRSKPSPLWRQQSTSAHILFSPLKRPAFLLTVSLAFKRMRNSATGSSLPALT